MKNKRVRVALITTEYPSEEYFAGGLASSLHRLALSLQRKGQLPEIFVSSNVTEDIEHEGIPVHRVQISLPDLPVEHPWVTASRALNQRLQEIHRKQNFDLAQYSNWQAPALFRLPNLPSVTRLSSFQPLLFPNTEGPGIRLTTLEDKLELLSIQLSDGVFSPSLFIAEKVQSFIQNPISVIETSFFIETTELDVSIWKQYFEGKKYFLFFGRLTENKGLLEIADVVSELLSLDPELHFALIGEDSSYKKSTMSEYVREKAGKAAERIIYLPPLRHQLLYPILQHAFAVVLPSHVDNLPNASFEAMAHGKIVVGTRGSSIEQLVRNGENGILVKMCSPASLLLGLKKTLLFSDAKRNKMEKAAKATAARLHPDKAIPRYLSFYRKAIRTHRKNKRFLSHLMKDGPYSQMIPQVQILEAYKTNFLLEQHLGGVVHPTSWKMTEPLRLIGSWVKSGSLFRNR